MPVRNYKRRHRRVEVISLISELEFSFPCLGKEPRRTEMQLSDFVRISRMILYLFELNSRIIISHEKNA